MPAREHRNGRAFEYALASAFSRIIGCEITRTAASHHAESMYVSVGEEVVSLKERFDTGSDNAARFLISKDEAFENAHSVKIQDDSHGRLGDVRDILVHYQDGEIGISAKHNHSAVKHSRLSDRNDFGQRWGGCPVSEDYWNRVRPVFERLRQEKERGRLFRDLPDKIDTIYNPVLSAFEDELRRLCQDNSNQFIKQFFHYLVGMLDYYKVICLSNQVVVESINLDGTLRWGSKWETPTRIERIERKERSDNTVLVNFEGGWQLSFRIHNATTRAEPSLKFDIQFTCMPNWITRNEIPFR